MPYHPVPDVLHTVALPTASGEPVTNFLRQPQGTASLSPPAILGRGNLEVFIALHQLHPSRCDKFIYERRPLASRGAHSERKETFTARKKSRATLQAFAHPVCSASVAPPGFPTLAGGSFESYVDAAPPLNESGLAGFSGV